MKNVLSFFLLVGVVTGLTTCQPHPNTSLRRFSYAFRTRYNVYYHAKKEFTQSLKELSQTTYPPDSVLQLFDGCIRKCEKAIRLYSIRQKPLKTGLATGCQTKKAPGTNRI